MSRASDITLLRDLIDRRPDLNACALKPGQAVHVHALERILEVAALETFEEMCAYEEGAEPPIKPGEVDALILRARELVGYMLGAPGH